MPAADPHFSLPTHLALRTGAALLLTLFAGALSITEPLWGMGLAVVGIGLLAFTLAALHRRLTAALDQCALALQQLGEGRNAFRLDAHGLPCLEPLLLAIDDLRETVEVATPVVRTPGARRIQRTPAAAPPLQAAWLNG